MLVVLPQPRTIRVDLIRIVNQRDSRGTGHGTFPEWGRNDNQNSVTDNHRPIPIARRKSSEVVEGKDKPGLNTPGTRWAGLTCGCRGDRWDKGRIPWEAGAGKKFREERSTSTAQYQYCGGDSGGKEAPGKRIVAAAAAAAGGAVAMAVAAAMAVGWMRTEVRVEIGVTRMQVWGPRINWRK